MKYTKIAEDAFKALQLNAGILLDTFDPETAEVNLENIMGATSGGVHFKATPTFTDFGEDVDNCPNNMLEFKKLSMWNVELSGTFITVDAEAAKTLIGAADVSATKITPRNILEKEDFKDIWWVGDYSDKNGETNGGFIAIHMLNALSTGGFEIQSGKDVKGQFAFTFTGHYSLENQTQVPFEVYIKEGQE
ncbi:MAG: hypothetical protein UIM25_00415 [Bacteroidales bacterium]|nr:hypothetical protein [Bacteroidales bacterium]